MKSFTVNSDNSHRDLILIYLLRKDKYSEIKDNLIDI